MTYNANLTPPNIRGGVNVGGVVGTLGSLGWASASGTTISSSTDNLSVQFYYNVSNAFAPSNSRSVDITVSLSFVPKIVILVSDASVPTQRYATVYINGFDFVHGIPKSSIIVLSSSSAGFYADEPSVVVSSSKIILPIGAKDTKIHWYAYA